MMSENVRERRSVEGGQCEDLRTCDHDAITKDKQAYVDCKCEWGLFRDRNVTLRKPITMNHGIQDLGKKGWVSQYDGSAELGWWQKGSSCDKVGQAFISLDYILIIQPSFSGWRSGWWYPVPRGQEGCQPRDVH